mgnify:CR=1 FL=1
MGQVVLFDRGKLPERTYSEMSELLRRGEYMNIFEFIDKHIIFSLVVIVLIMVVVDNMWANWCAYKTKRLSQQDKGEDK